MHTPVSSPAGSEAAPAGNCRGRRRPRADGALRPTDVVGAFFIGGVAFLLAAAVAGLVQWLDPWPWGRWLALCLAALALLVNVAASLRDAPRPLSLAARLVGVAQPFLLAGLMIAALASIQDGAAGALVGSTRAAVGTLLVAGWIGLTVAGSLLHLLALLLRVRDFSRRMPAARPRLDRLVAALAALGVAAVALSQSIGSGGWGGLARVVLLIAYAVLGARIMALAGRVLTQARPSI